MGLPQHAARPFCQSQLKSGTSWAGPRGWLQCGQCERVSQLSSRGHRHEAIEAKLPKTRPKSRPVKAPNPAFQFPDNSPASCIDPVPFGADHTVSSKSREDGITRLGNTPSLTTYLRQFYCHPSEGWDPLIHLHNVLGTAQALPWIPACAGMTERKEIDL